MAYRPTAKDLAVFERSRGDGSIFTAYYFDGFVFQDRPWQQAFHHAKQDDITVVAGVGSGKTTGVGLSAATYAATLPYFRFMNVAPTLWQAMLMYSSILMWADGAEFAKFVVGSVTRPYPRITLYNGSTLEFMSAANNLWRIQGWEGDWMNLDEGGLIEDGDLSIANMGTRLRGNIKGRRRLGRLSVVGMSSEAPWLWERLDMGVRDPGNYLSIVTRTAENLDPEDVERMKRRIPKELWAVHLEGARPVGTGEEFSYQVIQRCEDRDLNRWIEEEIVAETDGFIYEEAPSIGCIRCQLPPLKGHRYILAADVGQSNPPLRNSPVVMVWDVTDFPDEPVTLAYFHWIAGHGSYHPFLNGVRYAYDLYQPEDACFDATGTQKGFDELVFLTENMLMTPFSFAGNEKMFALNSAKLLMDKGLVRFPFIYGIRSQLLNYHLPDTKLAQDIVSTMCMMAQRVRRILWSAFSGDEGDEGDVLYLPGARGERSDARGLRKAA